MNFCGSTINWATTGSMLQGIGTLLGALAVLVAAYWGANTFDAWRRQKVTERHIDQAERILTATYKARRALKYVRGVMMWAHELSAAEKHLKENNEELWNGQPEDRQKRLVTVQAYYNRLNRAQEEREELDRCLPMARALFGHALEEAIEKLNHQFWIVQVDVDTYLDDDGSDPNFTNKIRRGMYDIKPPANQINEVSQAVEEAVKVIEDTCLPALRLEKSKPQLERNQRA